MPVLRVWETCNWINPQYKYKQRRQRKKPCTTMIIHNRSWSKIKLCTGVTLKEFCLWCMYACIYVCNGVVKGVWYWLHVLNLKFITLLYQIHVHYRYMVMTDWKREKSINRISNCVYTRKTTVLRNWIVTTEKEFGCFNSQYSIIFSKSVVAV